MTYLRRGFLKSAHRPNRLYCYVDPFPFFGLTIVLLVIFMVIFPQVGGGAYIDLARSSHSHQLPMAVKEDAIRITITRDGTAYFRKQRVGDLNVLPNRIHDAVLNGAEKKVYLVVDARALYRDVKAVLPQIQLAGIEKVCFITE